MKTQVITYQITLLEPALVTALDGDSNSAVAYPYLPGSVLRGALIASYLADKGTLADQLLDDGDATRMFFGGSVCYLNGYPWDGRFRSLPTPRSWQQDKREASAEDMSVSDFILRTDDPDDETPWVGVEQPFTVLDLAERRAALMKPIRQVAVHTQRDPVYGRPRSNEGQIYRYDALAAGQVFSAAIVINADANPQAAGDSKLLLHLLDRETAIGGSRTGGYGRVKFTGARLVDNSDRWREIGRHNID
ncbi:MAG: hypothetical protein M1546_23865, partial [Chloroflexi bacterium]|nr:hypothetical protein [Chloroflexota bacterium]